MHGILLKLIPVNDTNAISEWLTDDDQIFTLFASHYKTSKKKFPNSLELFSAYELAVSPNGQQMPWLNEAYSVQTFSNFTADLNFYVCACASLEAIASMLPQDTRLPGIFTTTLQTWAAMTIDAALAPLALAWFEARLCQSLGFLPDENHCAACGQPMTTTLFFQQEQGFMCPRCAGEQTNIPAYLPKAIRRLVQNPLQTILTNALHADAPDKCRLVSKHALQFLTAIMGDVGRLKNLKAHRCMTETLFGQPDV